MDQADTRPSTALLELVNGFRVSQAIHVATTLGIADLLKNGPRRTDELAVATRTHAGALYRLLRALASIGVFRGRGSSFRADPAQRVFAVRRARTGRSVGGLYWRAGVLASVGGPAR